MNWQKIETLPHDGTSEDQASCGKWHGPVLVYFPDQYGGVMMVAQLDSDIWLHGPDENHAFAVLTVQPTHWMPLPEPPHE